jgi:hypothetical protein
MRQPKFPLACALFTTALKDRQQSLFEEHVCQAHVSLVASNHHLQQTAIVLTVGFALGYGVREGLSRRRRRLKRHRPELL